MSPAAAVATGAVAAGTHLFLWTPPLPPASSAAAGVLRGLGGQPSPYAEFARHVQLRRDIHEPAGEPDKDLPERKGEEGRGDERRGGRCFIFIAREDNSIKSKPGAGWARDGKTDIIVRIM